MLKNLFLYIYNLISEFILQIEFNFMVSHIQKTRFQVEIISTREVSLVNHLTTDQWSVTTPKQKILYNIGVREFKKHINIYDDIIQIKSDIYRLTGIRIEGQK